MSEADLSDIYLLLENENSWWYEEFNSTDQDQKEQEQINRNPFTIKSIMIQRNQRTKPAKKRLNKTKSSDRLDYYLFTVKDWLSKKNDLMMEHIKTSKDSCYERVNENHSIQEFSWNGMKEIKRFDDKMFEK